MDLEAKMAKTNFDRYVEKRQRNLSVEAKIAQEVFTRAYSLSNAVLEIRQMKSMSQLKLAELSGVQQADISRIENGSQAPSMPTFFKLMDAMGVTMTLEVGEKRLRTRKSNIRIERVSA